MSSDAQFITAYLVCGIIVASVMVAYMVAEDERSHVKWQHGALACFGSIYMLVWPAVVWGAVIYALGMGLYKLYRYMED